MNGGGSWKGQSERGRERRRENCHLFCLIEWIAFDIILFGTRALARMPSLWLLLLFNTLAWRHKPPEPYYCVAFELVYCVCLSYGRDFSRVFHIMQYKYLRWSNFLFGFWIVFVLRYTPCATHRSYHVRGGTQIRITCNAYRRIHHSFAAPIPWGTRGRCQHASYITFCVPRRNALLNGFTTKWNAKRVRTHTDSRRMTQSRTSTQVDGNERSG